MSAAEKIRMHMIICAIWTVLLVQESYRIQFLSGSTEKGDGKFTRWASENKTNRSWHTHWKFCWNKRVLVGYLITL